MKKIGRLNIIEESKCTHPCDCGWNIIVGGTNKKDLKTLKKLLKESFPVLPTDD